jgi:hypothetical protein
VDHGRIIGRRGMQCNGASVALGYGEVKVTKKPRAWRLCENSLPSWQNNRDMARGYFL